MNPEQRRGRTGVSSQPDVAALTWSQEAELLLHQISLCSWAVSCKFFPSPPFCFFSPPASSWYFWWASGAALCPAVLGLGEQGRLFSSSCHCYCQGKWYSQAACAAHLLPFFLAADESKNTLKRAGLSLLACRCETPRPQLLPSSPSTQLRGGNGAP